MDLVIIGQDGSESTVRVDRRAGVYSVEVDGVSYEVDRVKLSDGQRSLLIEGSQSELSVVRLKAGRYLVTSRRGEATFDVRDPLDHLARTTSSPQHEGAQSVTAYMPGRVVTILAAVGDEVEQGQGIVVLEAMKMENEIATEIAGRVSEIFVEAGQSVEGGDPLFEIESL